MSDVTPEEFEKLKAMAETMPEVDNGDDAERIDTALRPRNLDEFIGQEKVVKRLKLWIQAARERDEPLGHILFSGPPGLGKTTLAYLIHTTMEAGRLVNVSGAALARPGDLVGTLSSLARGDVLFIDEIHRMSSACEEYLYTAMEDWRFDVTAGEEGTISIDLPHFTLVGATTRAGQLTAPLRARFRISDRLNPYDHDALATIVQASAKRLNVNCERDAALAVARRSRGTPRIANTMLYRLRDVVQTNRLERLTVDVANAGMDLLGIDHNGLDEIDRRYLQALEEAGRPVGIKALAVRVAEDERTLEDAHEPYLIEKGLVDRTLRGREITERGRVALDGGAL
jgi:Holliday junction DNA helicase RuvB